MYTAGDATVSNPFASNRRLQKTFNISTRGQRIYIDVQNVETSESDTTISSEIITQTFEKGEETKNSLMDLPLVPAQTQVTSKEKEERDVFMAKMKSMMMISWQVLCQNPGLQSLLNLDGITCDPIWCTTQCGIVTQKSVTNWLNYSRPGIGPQCIPSSVLGTTLSKDSATYTLSTTADGPVGNAIAAGTRGINDLTLTAGLLARARSRLPTGRRCSHICYGLRRVLQIRVGAHSWRYPARLTCVSDASDRNGLSYRARSQTGLFTQCTDVWNS